MKFVFALFALAAVAVCSVSATAGQSACKDPSEVGQTYPHHFEHNHYWYCVALGEPAIEIICPDGLAYMHFLRECIPWTNWIWKKPVNPPTLA